MPSSSVNGAMTSGRGLHNLRPLILVQESLAGQSNLADPAEVAVMVKVLEREADSRRTLMFSTTIGSAARHREAPAIGSVTIPLVRVALVEEVLVATGVTVGRRHR